MHLLVREIRTLDEQAQAEDLGHAPSDIIFLSFSDSDLGTLSLCLNNLEANFPTVQLVSLSRLRHPMSVDLYIETVIAHSRCVILRLLGGLEYWRYGTEEISAVCREKHIPLIVLSGDGHEDPKLENFSTVSAEIVARFRGFFYESGKENLLDALYLAASLFGYGSDQGLQPKTLPMVGEYLLPFSNPHNIPAVLIIFYRAHLLACDTAPIDALAVALHEQNLNVHAIFVSSLKDSDVAQWIERYLHTHSFTVILNVTCFSARQEARSSPLDQANIPVLQIIQAGSTQPLWESSFRGLSQSDLAMQVVLPELDGRLLTTTISFKQEQNGILQHSPYPEGIKLVVERTKGWTNLATTANTHKKIAILLSNYPGAGGQEGHAVGLDSFASLYEILHWLEEEGYSVGNASSYSVQSLTEQLCQGKDTPILSLEDYQAFFSTLPESFRHSVLKSWPNIQTDPAFVERNFTLKFLQFGHVWIAIQPNRGSEETHKILYHDPDAPPAHGYIATYFWLRLKAQIQAIIHLGTHGTMEWLPGKTAALSDHCVPTVLLRGLPVIYPFIVNNPGEAACAKRRLGAVTIGHLTPPVNKAILHGNAAELERLIDDYAEADGLDQRRTQILIGAILDKAEACGLLIESGIDRRKIGDEVALSRLDAYLCDVKDLQIREGLHIFGKPPIRRTQLLEAMKAYAPEQIAILEQKLDACAYSEKQALLQALNGKFISSGPAGAPTRGRLDVLPTGRNLYTVDPRSIPTQTAYLLAEKAAENLLLHYMQENGDALRHLVIDLWGSTSLRTGGEDLALAYILMGTKPLWDKGSGRVTGIEILPIALLNRPRVDVTLRISGLFRDAFEAQLNLFDQTVNILAAQEEDADWNIVAATTKNIDPTQKEHHLTRIYGTAPGGYGAGIEKQLSIGNWQNRDELGKSWIQNSIYAYGGNRQGKADRTGLKERLKEAQAFIHSQDHAEIDLLDSPDYAAHEGGFAAAAKTLNNDPILYHVDTSKPEDPKIRRLTEEIARIVRGRAANPDWIRSMMNHHYRGAAEISRTIDALYSFSATLSQRFDKQYDLVFAATLGNDMVKQFLKTTNPAAARAIKNRFKEACQRGLWHPYSNTVTMRLEEEE